jgi:hypothetical protein
MALLDISLIGVCFGEALTLARQRGGATVRHHVNRAPYSRMGRSVTPSYYAITLDSFARQEELNPTPYTAPGNLYNLYNPFEGRRGRGDRGRGVAKWTRLLTRSWCEVEIQSPWRVGPRDP